MSNRATLTIEVQSILLKDWDPIGVADEPAARDEYDSYVARVVGLVASAAPVSEIVSHLVQIETDLMGLRGNRERAERVARKLAALR